MYNDGLLTSFIGIWQAKQAQYLPVMDDVSVVITIMEYIFSLGINAKNILFNIKEKKMSSVH